MNPVLTLDHVSYSYHTPSGETPALKDVSFSVRPAASPRLPVLPAAENPHCFP